MKYDLNSLNEEQLKALKEINGAVLVTAGAGSGKTRLLTHRIAYLIKEMGVSPYSILAITFTNKAAGEMKERVSEMVDGAERVWISTFHSMCSKILRSEIDVLKPFDKNFTIYNESDSEKVLKEIFAERGINDDDIKKSVSFHLSNWKNNGQGLEDYINTHADEFDIRKIGSMIMAYQDKLKKNNALDFDDLLMKTYEIFTKFPEVLEKYSRRFEYVLVDEFQDTNLIQYKIVKMLSSFHGNIFVVGDEDQCIYSWRGANFRNIFDFKNSFHDVKFFKLERNYRSTNEIITVANNVIKNNKERLEKNMWTSKSGGQVPTLFNAYDEKDEASYVAKNIAKLIAEGYKYDDIAVLMRVNALSRSFEEAFLSYNIPHRIYGGFKFFERAEIKILIAYLRLFVNPRDDVSFARVINFPKRGIGDGTISKLQAIDFDKSLLENVLSDKLKENQSLFKKFEGFVQQYENCVDFSQKILSEFVERVISSFKLREAFNPKDEEDLNRIMNISQFVSSVKDYESLNPDATLGEFLETITLSSDTDEIGEGGAVTIATVHAVKGLEFKVVFVVGVEEGIFPISRAFDSQKDMEEERRLMYVALTRAEEILCLSYASKRYMYNSSEYKTPSRFVRELGLITLSPKRSDNFSKFKGNSYDREWSNEFNDFPYESSQPKPLFNHNNFFKKEKKEEPRKDVSIYKIGQQVEHPRYGLGEIVDISSDGLVGDIVFEDFGKKSLMLDLAPLKIIE